MCYLAMLSQFLVVAVNDSKMRRIHDDLASGGAVRNNIQKLIFGSSLK